MESREFTGVGFFTKFCVKMGTSSIVPPVNGGFGDVIGTIGTNQVTLLFNLYITNGYLDTLEGHTLSEAWPKDYKNLILRYNPSGERDFSTLGMRIPGLPFNSALSKLKGKTWK